MKYIEPYRKTEATADAPHDKEKFRLPSAALSTDLVAEHDAGQESTDLHTDVPTRTIGTEARYIQVAKRLIKKFENENFGNNSHIFNCEEFVNWLVGKKEQWGKATWRQYKSASVYCLRFKLGDLKCREAAAILEEVGSTGCKKKASGGSAGRIKNTSPKKFDQFIEALNTTTSKYKRYKGVAIIWMRLGSITGLRPHEWSQAAIVRNIDSQDIFFESHKLTPGHTYLRVRNSKHTNGRANGEYRHLDVSEFDDNLLEQMDKFIRIMSNRVRYPVLYENCRRLVADTNRHLFGNNSTRRFHLYSARHRFASEAKKQFSRDFVAAAMGHGNDHTAFSTYGNSRHASGGRIAKPVEAEAMTVKKVSSGSEKFLNNNHRKKFQFK